MRQPVSLLVDGDNVSGKYAKQIRSFATKRGDLTVGRVYTDARQNCEWHDALGYRMVHAGTGKNAADVLLALDALELLLLKKCRYFLIASSDGDFCHLATRLREYGATVIGIGEEKAPKPFRASCSEFIEINKVSHVQLVPKTALEITEFDLKIRSLITVHSEKGLGMRIVDLAAQMRSVHSINIGTIESRGWRAHLTARPSLYDLDPRGPDAKVRFQPAGFAQAA